MSFCKKILILKQTKGGKEELIDISGVCRIEHEDDTLTLSLSLINAPFVDKGEYCCLLYLENNAPEIFSLSKKPSSLIKSFNKKAFNGVSVGIFLVCENKSTLLSFGSEEGISENAIISLFGKENCSFTYDDEAVATENYYSIEENIEKKIDFINRAQNGNRKNENSKEYKACEEKEKECFSTFNPLQDEKCAKESNVYTREHPYYLTAEPELEELFTKFPSDESLSQTLPNGRFCKIKYANDKHYLVGTLKEKGEVKYVCYGVPMEYSKEPPSKLKDYCSFIPLSFFDLQGKGVWMMFQDAVTGECIKKKD